jgi:hypothetical protein
VIERRGGKREGAGRPRGEPSMICTFYLTKSQIDLLKKWGGGNASAGLRWLIDQASKMIHLPDETPPHSNG